MRKRHLITAFCLLMAGSSYAQLSTNQDKFLGNITTRGQVNGGGIDYATLWNQITPENESKWASIEGTRNSMNWTGCDNAYNYAKNHKFPFKFHTLVWGSQYPGWLDKLSSAVQMNEIKQWMDAIKRRYPNLEMIDVVNEAIPGHAPAPYKDALGGDGTTGIDWIIKAFEMAAERWPNAILIYNDFNTFQWQKTEFINLVKTLRDAGAPIDAYGCQSHDLTDMDVTSFRNAMTEIQNALKMPMYSTEYDIGTSDDAKQLQRYKEQIPYMWERPYCAGVTLWGYIYGATWTTDGNSGIIRNGQDRPAMTWLREYMASDKAKNAVSPFPGMKKEASLYIKPQALNITVNEEARFDITARLRTKTLDKVVFYINNVVQDTLTEAPFVSYYTPTRTGVANLKAVAYDTEGNSYVRQQTVTVAKARKPFKDTMAELPGIVEAENFDTGAEGVAFHETNATREGDAATYRTDCGVDVVKGNGGYALGYTIAGEWMEYTVNVTDGGQYDYEAVVSSGTDGSAFSMSLWKDGKLVPLTNNISVTNGGSWDTYRTIKGSLLEPLDNGQQRIRINITGTYVNIDKINFICTLSNAIDDIAGENIGTFDVYGADGMTVGQVTVQDGQDIRQQVRNISGHGGMYILKNPATGVTVKLMVK